MEDHLRSRYKKINEIADLLGTEEEKDLYDAEEEAAAPAASPAPARPGTSPGRSIPAKPAPQKPSPFRAPRPAVDPEPMNRRGGPPSQNCF